MVPLLRLGAGKVNSYYGFQNGPVAALTLGATLLEKVELMRVCVENSLREVEYRTHSRSSHRSLHLKEVVPNVHG